MNKNTKIIIISLIVIVILTFIIIKNFISTKNIDYKTEIVTDYSMFFTVDTCVNRFIGYISDGESDKVLNVLNNEYITSNNIDINNVIYKIDSLNIKDSIATFKSINMYQKQINRKLTEYYVEGKIYLETCESKEFLKNYYVKVRINTNNNTFDITPYDEELFKEELK